MELDSLGSVNSMQGLDHSMTERELFTVMSSATGVPPEPEPPMVIGLNLVSSVPCAIYQCRPTQLMGIHIVLNPDDEAALALLGDVDLTLRAVNGRISFSMVEGQQHTHNSNARDLWAVVLFVLTSLLFSLSVLSLCASVQA